MDRYESYKDSGIAWIGQVPSHWVQFRIKFCLSRSVAGIWGDDEKGNKDDIVCFRVADFDYSKGCLTFDKLTIRNVATAQLQNRLLHDGDLLIEKSGGGETTPVGRVIRFNYNNKAICSNFIHSISIKEGYFSNYLYYYFYGMYANKVNQLYFNQTTGIQNLKVGEYLSQKIYLPTLVEQQAIAAYLDKRCGKIDKAIATQQKRITLLQELKQSIITHAVTRGIHPDVPLKDSGIEWIGRVPEHWDVLKMNQVCNVITDYVASGSFADLKKNVTYLDSPDYAMLIRTADLSNKNKDISRVYVSKRSYRFLSNSNLFGGEIILPNVGSVGDVYLVPQNFYDRMTLGPNAVMVKTKYNNLYYYYYFSSIRGRNSLELLGFASVQGKFNKTELRQLKVPVPSIVEQNEIVSYIEGHTNHIDLSVTKVQQRITLLQELKQSVITEAITGKIKVC